MATLHVRNVPDELYGRVRELASANSRSLGAEVVKLLGEALGNHEPRAAHAEALESLRRRRWVPPADKNIPDSTELLREDRER